MRKLGLSVHAAAEYKKDILAGKQQERIADFMNEMAYSPMIQFDPYTERTQTNHNSRYQTFSPGGRQSSTGFYMRPLKLAKNKPYMKFAAPTSDEEIR